MPVDDDVIPDENHGDSEVSEHSSQGSGGGSSGSSRFGGLFG
jgi:hypothetical protein